MSHIRNPRRRQRVKASRSVEIDIKGVAPNSFLEKSKFKLITTCSSNGHKERVIGASFGIGKPFNSWAVSVGADRRAIFWKYQENVKKADLEIPANGWLTCVDWQGSKGDHVAIGSSDGKIHVYNKKSWETNKGSGNPVAQQICHDGFVNSVKFAKDKPNELYSCSTDWTFHVMDLNKPEQRKKFRFHSNDVTCIDVNSESGTFLVTSSADYSCMIWDRRQQEPAIVFDEYESVVNSVCFAANGTEILTGCDDGVCKLYDIRSSHDKNEFSDPSTKCPITSVNVVGGRFALALQAGVVKIWDTQDAKSRFRVLGETEKASIGANTLSLNVHQHSGSALIITTYMDRKIRTWNVVTKKS